MIYSSLLTSEEEITGQTYTQIQEQLLLLFIRTWSEQLSAWTSKKLRAALEVGLESSKAGFTNFLLSKAACRTILAETP